MTAGMIQWRHVFKLDPDRELTDMQIQRLCSSGTDAIIVGGSSGITYENTEQLLNRLRPFSLPCVLEVSEVTAVVPGFDHYLIPFVLNAGSQSWLIGKQLEAIQLYGDWVPWERLSCEAYIVLNAQSEVARKTTANCELDTEEIIGYARLADKLLHFPIVYLEYSGTFGQLEVIEQVSQVLDGARLFYGGGIDGPARAAAAARYADTIIVGNVIYEQFEQAIETVQATKCVEKG